MHRTFAAAGPARERKFELSIMRLSFFDQQAAPAIEASFDGSRTPAASASSPAHFKRRICSIALIFFTLLLRAVWSCLLIRGHLGRKTDSCAACDGSCQDQGTVINTYLFFSPEFSFSVIFLSEPLSYLVAICTPPPTSPSPSVLLATIIFDSFLVP